ncbi:MAG TPA: hypothetical protein H9858_01965 [Candidatus Blautia stercoravium]|nr:hypothetical protein [Candidatus Blautia stercoravium]
MSKILKIIVNLVVLFSIIIAAALLVPPFAGVDTVMNDNTGTDTNLPVGSVAYGKSVNVKKLEKKDKIIYNEGSSTYIYEIQDMDASAGVYQVKDVYSKSSDTENINLKKSVPKVVAVVPFIGYAAIALQSKEGLIVVGVGIVFLVILFILSELWRKDRDEEDDEEDDEEYEDVEEEEDEDDEDDEEEELSFRERRRLKKEERQRRKLAKKGLLDDEEEDEDEELPPASAEKESPELQGFDDAMKDAMSSIAMGVAAVSEPEQAPDATIVMPNAEELENAAEQAGQEVAQSGLKTEQAEISVEPETEVSDSENHNNIEETESEEAEEEAAIDVNAVPKSPSVQELLAKAQAAGEAPEIKTDEENKVTLLDYSDIV